MCGIAGKFLFDASEVVSEGLITSLLDAIIHRGPDDVGIHVDRNFGFGMRRLAIIDVATGQQPVFSGDKSVSVVFNGEIFNYLELRSELVQLGCTFSSRSDTEVILHAYLQWGTDFVSRLNGMFAIAIRDIRAGDVLLLYRDRIGVKPLYYYADEKQLLFGSEIKAIIADRSIQRKLNKEALTHYLALGMVPYPMSMISGILKLSPGHVLQVSSGVVEISQYWQLRTGGREHLSIDDCRDEFLTLFDDAVSKRMISDVPIGAFLSGGIDSSAVVAYMAKHTDRPIKTFSIGMKEGGEHDETRYATEVSNLFKTDHTVFKVGSEMVELMDAYVTHFDEPFGDYAAFPTYVVSQLAREHVTVVLTGDGGDEIFAGYSRYANERIADYHALLPGFVREGLLSPALKGLSSLFQPNSSHRIFLDSVNRRNIEAGLPRDRRYYHRLAIFTANDRAQLLKRDTYETAFDIWSQGFWNERLDGLTNQLVFDTLVILPEGMMTKVDRVTMANSLEARSPFVDYRVVEFAHSLPSEFKLKGLNLKYFLKYSFADVLPHHILHRKKHGFSTPLDKWLRNDLKLLVQSTLSRERILESGLFNPDYIDRIIGEHYAGKGNHGEKIFMLMVFVLWLEKYEVGIE